MRQRTASTRVLLLALVCVPLAAFGVVGGADIAGRVQATQAAQSQAIAIRLVGQVVNAQAGTESLILPVLYRVAVEDPALVAQAGFTPSLLPLINTAFPASTVAAWQADVSHRLAAINLRALPKPLATTIAELIVQRGQTNADIASRSPRVSQDYTAETGLLQRMGQAEEALTSQLLLDQQATAGRTTLQDLQLTVALVGRADAEMPAYLPTAVLSAPSAAQRAGWLQTWAAYQSAAEAADAGLHGPLKAAWSRIEQDPAYRTLDASVAPSLGPAAAPDPQSFVALTATSENRTNELNQLLHQAVARAVTAVDTQRDQAAGQMWSTAIVTGALIVGTLVLTLLAGRALSRPLRRLAEEADRISEGELVEVSPGGTTEVRRAGEALRATSATLRRVEQQAAEMAAGRLDSALRCEPIPGPLGAAVHGSLRRIVEAIREREVLQSELAHQLAHDPLTALPNRAVALEHTEAALARSARAEQVLGVLFIDLDDFKAINEAHGHAAGDRALQVVAGRLRECTRAGDTVCRLGGDEFLVVVEDADSELAIVETAHRTIEALSASLPLGAVEVAVRASIGVAVTVDARSTADSLLAEAEAAVNRAKTSGGGRVEVFDAQLRAALNRQTDITRGIRDGLHHDEFTLVYQPVVDVATARVHSHEALIRWDRPGRPQVMPTEFIPEAEASGLIGDLGRWVLLEATAQVRRWTDELAGQGQPPTVAVNVSGRQLGSPQLIADVREALDRSGIEPSQLILELTESVLVADLSAIDQLYALKALGVRVALDDFGTGYTSISQLGRFPVDILKIDRSFVTMLSTSDTLVRTMIQVAHSFSLEVIAEGVEDLHQLAALRSLGCDSVQGFLFSRPRSPDWVTRPGRSLPAPVGAPVRSA